MRKISYPIWKFNDSLVGETVDFSLQQFAIPPVTTQITMNLFAPFST